MYVQWAALIADALGTAAFSALGAAGALHVGFLSLVGSLPLGTS